MNPYDVLRRCAEWWDVSEDTPNDVPQPVFPINEIRECLAGEREGPPSQKEEEKRLS